MDADSFLVRLCSVRTGSNEMALPEQQNTMQTISMLLHRLWTQLCFLPICPQFLQLVAHKIK